MILMPNFYNIEHAMSIKHAGRNTLLYRGDI